MSITAMVETPESTTFTSGVHQSDPGLLGWEAELSGFYDPAVGGIGQQFETLLGANGGILSVYDDLANAIGDTGTLLSDGILDKNARSIAVADLVKLQATLKPSAPTGGARAGLNAVLLHPLFARTGSGAGTSVDNGASSANGGRANLHITAATGAGVISISDSADNSSFANLASFASAAVPGAQTIEIAGTIRQYTRIQWVNGANSLTFVAGLARY